MNRLSIERWPERVKRLYQKYHPEDKDVTYGNLLEKIEEAIEEGNKYSLSISIYKPSSIETNIEIPLQVIIKEVQE